MRPNTRWPVLSWAKQFVKRPLRNLWPRKRSIWTVRPKLWQGKSWTSPSDLLHCTNEPNVSIPSMANLLIERTQNPNWVVVYKALITIHNLMCYGNEVFDFRQGGNEPNISGVHHTQNLKKEKFLRVHFESETSVTSFEISILDNDYFVRSVFFALS